MYSAASAVFIQGELFFRSGAARPGPPQRASRSSSDSDVWVESLCHRPPSVRRLCRPPRRLARQMTTGGARPACRQARTGRRSAGEGGAGGGGARCTGRAAGGSPRASVQPSWSAARSRSARARPRAGRTAARARSPISHQRARARSAQASRWSWRQMLNVLLREEDDRGQQGQPPRRQRLGPSARKEPSARRPSVAAASRPTTASATHGRLEVVGHRVGKQTVTCVAAVEDACDQLVARALGDQQRGQGEEPERRAFSFAHGGTPGAFVEKLPQIARIYASLQPQKRSSTERKCSPLQTLRCGEPGDAWLRRSGAERRTAERSRSRAGCAATN